MILGRGTSRGDLSLRVAQAVCVAAIAILIVAGATGYNGVVLGGVLLSVCFLAGVGVFVTTRPELSRQQRDLFRWITFGAALGAIAKVSWTLHFVSNGVRPRFPALADYLLLGAELAVVVGFVRLLYTGRAAMKLEAFADLILIAVAAGVIMLPLGMTQFSAVLSTLDLAGKVVSAMSLFSAAASLILLALLITWRGEELSRRAMLGLAVGTVATAMFTAWAAQFALSGARPLHVAMDVLAVAAILGFVSALDIRRSLPTLELKIAERTAALSGTVEELKGVITEERAMRAQIIERERLASIGSIVGGVAHEINNPLSSISAFAQLLLNEDGLSESQRDSLEAIYAEAMRAANVIKDLRAFARRSASENRAVDLNEIIGRTVRLRGYQMDSGHVAVRTELDPNLPMVTGDPQQLQQVVVNLMSNAIAAMKDGGELLIATCAERSTENKRVLVEFTDTGQGIPEGLRDRIFDPFLASQGFGEGVGMGLSVSYGIVAAHGGQLRLVDGSPGNTKFVVELPAARWQSQGSEHGDTASRVPGGATMSS
ncbi:MAG TPA: ATP-binding protein [Gemmatimonadaceae bacterium]|nr:ATP-binding protein [Gemmatimonadaceae bacterium]